MDRRHNESRPLVCKPDLPRSSDAVIWYILDNEDGYLFSSITASYKCDIRFERLNADGLGFLEMDFEQAEFVINDGQHRCAAIAHALKESPALGDESISVLLFPYESKERVQQMFSDLNRYVVKEPPEKVGHGIWQLTRKGLLGLCSTLPWKVFWKS